MELRFETPISQMPQWYAVIVSVGQNVTFRHLRNEHFWRPCDRKRLLFPTEIFLMFLEKAYFANASFTCFDIVLLGSKGFRAKIAAMVAIYDGAGQTVTVAHDGYALNSTTGMYYSDAQSQ